MNSYGAPQSSFPSRLERVGNVSLSEENPRSPPLRPTLVNRFDGVLTRPSGIGSPRNVELDVAHGGEAVSPTFDQELKHWVDRSLATNLAEEPNVLYGREPNHRHHRKQYITGIADQFSSAYSTGSDSLELRGSALYQIDTLPACLSKMLALRDLTLKNLGISSLRSLPPYLTNLSITACRLRSLPNLPRQLVTLQIDQNQLTALPELPYTLRVLKATGNALRSLPNFPETIGYVDVSNNELEHLEISLPKLPKLRYLNVAFNRLGTSEIDPINEQIGEILLDCSFPDEKAIRTPEDGIRRELRQARCWVSNGPPSEQDDRRKAFSEIERVYGQFGNVLDLSSLNLSELPSSLQAVSHISELRMDGNILTPETYWYRRPAYSANGFSAKPWSNETIATLRATLGWETTRNVLCNAVVNAPSAGVEIINKWYFPTDSSWVDHMEAWQKICQETHAPLFLAFLTRLPETFEYRQPEAQAGFIARVEKLLVALGGSKELRNLCFAKAIEVENRSDAGIALMLNDVETTRVRHDAEKNPHSLDELHKIGQGLFRLQVVEEETTKKIAEMKATENQGCFSNIDEISIRLRQHVKLANRLGLPVAEGVGSQKFSEKTDGDLLDIEHKVAEFEQNNEYVRFFTQWAPWRAAIQSQNPAAFGAINSIIERRAIFLETRPTRTSDEEWHRQIAAFQNDKNRWLDAPMTKLTRNYLCPESDSDD